MHTHAATRAQWDTLQQHRSSLQHCRRCRHRARQAALLTRAAKRKEYELDEESSYQSLQGRLAQLPQQLKQSASAKLNSNSGSQPQVYRVPNVDRPEPIGAKEKFFGRLAVLGFGAVLLGERVTGRGVVQQLEMSATNIPLWEMEPLLAGIVLAFTAAAVWPPRFSSSYAEQQRGAEPTWIDKVQHLSGRAACLGLAGTITAEVATGKGALALLNVETGIETISEIEAVVAFFVMLLLTEDIKRKGSKGDGV